MINEIKLKLIIDSKKKRKIAILSALFNSTQMLSYKELSEHCNAAIKTIKKDCEELIDELEEFIYVSYKDGQYFLRKYSDVNIDRELENYIETLLNEDLLCLIITDLFHGKLYSINEIVDTYFVTHSTLNRYFSILKEVLTEYDLKLTTTPVDIIGKETNIRYFYSQYFDDKYCKKYTTFSEEALLDAQKVIKKARVTVQLSENGSLAFDYNEKDRTRTFHKIRGESSFEY